MPATATNDRFSFLPNTESAAIRRNRASLEELLEQESTQEFRSNFSDLDIYENKVKLANLINDYYQGSENLNIPFLAGLIGYSYEIFKDKERDTGAPFLTHFVTPALFAGKLNLNPRVIYGFLLHDISEEILDSILESRYADNLFDILRMDDLEFKMRIKNLNDNFEDAGNNKNEFDLKKRIMYPFVRVKVLRAVYSELKDIAKKSGESQTTVQNIMYAQDAITRDNTRSYDYDMKRILSNFSYFITKQFVLRPSFLREPISYLVDISRDFFYFMRNPLNFREKNSDDLEHLKIDILAEKCLDGLHNLMTEKEVYIPSYNRRGKSLPKGTDKLSTIDHKVAALSKRLGVVDAIRDFLLMNMNTSDYMLSKDFEGIYHLHLLLAATASKEAKEMIGAFLTKYSDRKVRDTREITYAEKVENIKTELGEYERAKLLDRVTHLHDEVETAFIQDYGFTFAGTIRRLTDYASKIRTQSLYHNFAVQVSPGSHGDSNIFQFLKDIISMNRVLERYLAKGINGRYDPALRLVHMGGYVAR